MVKWDIMPEPVKIFSNQELARIFTQIGAGVARMHDLGIIHGDLTTSNIIYESPLDSDDVEPASWTQIATGTGTFSFNDPASLTKEQRFYKVVTP